MNIKKAYFWTEKKIINLPDQAKLLYFYLLTSPHNNTIGFYRLPYEYITADLTWENEKVTKEFEFLIEKTNLIEYDKDAAVVLIKDFLHYNPIKNKRTEEKALKEINALEENRLFYNFLDIIKTIKTFPDEIKKAVELRVYKDTFEEIKDDTRLTSDNDPAVIITLLLNDGSEYPVTEEQLKDLSELYPAVDIMQELRKMKGWLIANPFRRKTKRGILRFINHWLSKQQDKGGNKKKMNFTFKNYDNDEDFLSESSIKTKG